MPRGSSPLHLGPLPYFAFRFRRYGSAGPHFSRKNWPTRAIVRGSPARDTIPRPARRGKRRGNATPDGTVEPKGGCGGVLCDSAGRRGGPPPTLYCQDRANPLDEEGTGAKKKSGSAVEPQRHQDTKEENRTPLCLGVFVVQPHSISSSCLGVFVVSIDETIELTFHSLGFREGFPSHSCPKPAESTTFIIRVHRRFQPSLPWRANPASRVPLSPRPPRSHPLDAVEFSRPHLDVEDD